MIDNPLFWVTAVISVIITGISKGGFGGLALLAVPLMALTISPVQAAGIMLPILIVMDWVSVWSYRKHWDKRLLILMLPGAILGILAAWRFAAYVDDQFVRICVGLIAVLFPIYAVLKPTGREDMIVGNKPLGMISGIAAGFTSFIAHAGGPPFQAYAIPQGLEKRIYAGTAVMFFFVVNFVKLLPYAMLGQFDKANLTTSFILIPLAPIGVLIGVWLIKRIDQDVFYRILYGLIFAVGVKLLWDGLA
ncbi:sulfite exporter TauE/SafE family protein [Hellea balneolensis]|uniref:sulfite exporter TauE/SafE family protein n=1 Tax=Hellea balneolensis TaxID=287478 RepID=UPI000409E6A0|nr:sulfite exporter TauE/SafE family protein [Hellea balneolensis]